MMHGAEDGDALSFSRDLTVEGDPDHEAEDAIWVDFDGLDDVLSYPNERKIAWLYARKMKQG